MQDFISSFLKKYEKMLYSLNIAISASRVEDKTGYFWNKKGL